MLRLRLRWDGNGIVEEVDGNIGRRSRLPMEGGAVGVTVERLTQDATEHCSQANEGVELEVTMESLREEREEERELERERERERGGSGTRVAGADRESEKREEGQRN